MYMHIFSLVKLNSGPFGFVHPSETVGDEKDWTRWADMDFVVPVDKHNHLFPKYICRTIVCNGPGENETGPKLILRSKGKHLLALETPCGKIRFTPTKTCPHKYLPYVGRYKHEDFLYKFVVLLWSAKSHDVMEKLFEKKRMIFVGDIGEKYFK
jgi:hypothetical protein